MTDTPRFGHDRLAVYAASLRFLELAEQVLDAAAPRMRKNLADQLDRAATSVVLNIAEGAGEFSPPEKARFYRMARRSATECAAVLDILNTRQLCGEELIIEGREILWEIAAMLTSMVRKMDDSGPRVREEGEGYGDEAAGAVREGEGGGEGEGEGCDA
jgi:four helix bundle protein